MLNRAGSAVLYDLIWHSNYYRGLWAEKSLMPAPLLVLVRPSSIALKTLKNAAGQDLSVMSLQPPP